MRPTQSRLTCAGGRPTVVVRRKTGEPDLLGVDDGEALLEGMRRHVTR